MQIGKNIGKIILCTVGLLLVPCSSAFAGGLTVANTDGAINGALQGAVVGGIAGAFAGGLAWLFKKKPKDGDKK